MKASPTPRRLDVRLTAAVSILLLVWLVSILSTLHILQRERDSRANAIELMRINTKIERSLDDLVDEIILKHDEAILITLKTISDDLELSWIELKTQTNQSFKIGPHDPVGDTASEALIDQLYPLRLGDREYGRIRVIKRTPISLNPFFSDRNILIYSIFIFAGIFFLVRRFIRLEILTPLTTLIIEFGKVSEIPDVKKSIPIRSVEIERLATLLREMKESIRNLEIKRIEAEQRAVIGALAAQVSHDIRSPLAALSVAAGQAKGLEEETRIRIRNATNRIRDIANGLLAKNREPQADEDPAKSGVEFIVPEHSKEPRSAELLGALIEATISEKRLQYHDRVDVEIEFVQAPETFGVFSEVRPMELSRIISNAVNNSAEAFENGGKVEISLSLTEKQIRIQIKDNGKGIPQELLSKVIERGGTFGKKHGNGLGLSHAKTTIEAWGGNFSLESEVDQGTTITMDIWPSDTPSWFPKGIELAPGYTVVVADDDPSIHGIWNSRLDEYSERLNVVHLKSAKGLMDWYRQNIMVDNVVYLVDYEFAGEPNTGLAVIDMTGIARNSILVTTRWNEFFVQTNCNRIGLRLLPKVLAGQCPIKMILPESTT